MAFFNNIFEPPLFIPIPTPASVRGGPVACIGGFVRIRMGSPQISMTNVMLCGGLETASIIVDKAGKLSVGILSC